MNVLSCWNWSMGWVSAAKSLKSTATCLMHAVGKGTEGGCQKREKPQYPAERKCLIHRSQHKGLSWSLLKCLRAFCHMPEILPCNAEAEGTAYDQSVSPRSQNSKAACSLRPVNEGQAVFKDLWRPEKTTVSVCCSLPSVRPDWWAEEPWCDKTESDHLPFPV